MAVSQSPNLHEGLTQPIVPSLQTGAATGIGGFLIGGGIGILRSAHPGLAAAYTGTQFFILGSSFLYTREAVLRLAFAEKSNKAELTSSTAAGVVSGAAAGAFYGRVNSVAGAILIGTLGHVGQRYIHARSNLAVSNRDKRPLLERLADSKWIPFKSLSNEEYANMLNEKLLKVQAEISMIDEKIAGFRQEGNEEFLSSRKFEK